MKVVAAVIVRGGTVLAAKRPDDRPHPGKWEFPGGKVERGETLEQALRRELREELEIREPQIARVLWETTHRYPGREPVELTFFLVSVVEEEIRDGHFAELRWTNVGELPSLDFLEADREFIAALAAGRVRLEAACLPESRPVPSVKSR